MLTIVCFRNFCVNKVSMGFLQQLEPKKNKKTYIQLYRFGLNGLRRLKLVYIEKFIADEIRIFFCLTFHL